MSRILGTDPKPPKTTRTALTDSNYCVATRVAIASKKNRSPPHQRSSGIASKKDRSPHQGSSGCEGEVRVERGSGVRSEPPSNTH